MKFLFIVQGEGRGHMTQAIAMNKILEKNGHSITGVVIGKSKFRKIPLFFTRSFQCPLVEIESPNFASSSNQKGISILKTILYNSLKLPVFISSIKVLHGFIKQQEPDIIINFYEVLTGIYKKTHASTPPVYSIGHQFLLMHPDFVFPPRGILSRWLIKIHTRLTGMGSTKWLALSFKKMRDLPGSKIKIVPPLLREEVLKLKPKETNLYLVYVLNPGYAEHVKKYHEENSSTEIHLFGANHSENEEIRLGDKFISHKIDDKKFLHYMSICKGYATTAGFESICEAMYLGKPALMIPSYKHFEQECNALDAESAGAGIAAHEFNLHLLDNFIAKNDYRHTGSFREWADSAYKIYPRLLASLND
ncbi:MAG: glycosyltransferase family protein [Bacteroidales bacterium]